jgi:hypothetical protein
MKLLALRQLDRPANHRRMREFYVRIEKQDVRALRLRRSQVAANRGHSARNHTNIQPIAKAQHNFASAVG